jgi:hypothetical protein
MKRRIIERQTKINQAFQACKTNKSTEAGKLNLNFDKESDPTRGLNMYFQSGAHNTSTPFRSCSRVNKLLGGTPHQIIPGQTKIVETSQSTLSKMSQKLNEETKPSSAISGIT